VLLAKQLAKRPRLAEEPILSNNVLFEYFAGEILKHTEPGVRAVLVETALLPYLTPAMAGELTGRGDAGDVLAHVHRQNYFTTRRRDRDSTYEYHPLFRSFLLAELTHTYSQEAALNLKRRAATIADRADLVESAISLLNDLAAWTELADLISRRAPTWLANGRGKTVERWLLSLPSDIVEQSPWLLYWRASCQFAWYESDAWCDLERAFDSFRQQNDAAGAFMCWSAQIISLQAQSRPAVVDDLVARFDPLVAQFPEFPSSEVETHVAMAMLSVVLHRHFPNLNGARWAERAMALTRQQPNLGFRAITALNWYVYHFQLGNHARAAGVIDEMRKTMLAGTTAPDVAVMASVAVVWFEALTGLPSYRATTSHALELARSHGILHAARLGVVCGALMGALSDGDMTLAAEYAHEFGSRWDSLGPGHRCFYEMFIVLSSLARGDLATAAAHRADMVQYAVAGGWQFHLAAILLLSAEVLNQSGDRQEAEAAFQQASTIARVMGGSYAAFMVALTEADLRFDAGRDADGLRALATAMRLGRAGGFVNTPIWQPCTIARLCARALDANIEVEYVERLIRQRRLVLDNPSVDAEAWPWPVKIYTLGTFQVLKDGQPLQFIRKVQRKPLTLLKALIACGGERVREARLVDLLWPEADGDSALLALKTTIHRLRRLLGDEKAVVRQDGHVTLNSSLCWVDVLTVERLLSRAETLSSTADIEKLQRVLNCVHRLYRGPFLAAEEDLPWAGSMSSRVQRRSLRQFLRVATLHQQADQ
jgi:hypothetical protein